MQTTEQQTAVEILRTSNYDRFECDIRRRACNEHHVSAIALSLGHHGWISAYPCLCRAEGERLVVIDGMHRMLAAMRLGLAIEYVLTESEITPAEANSLPCLRRHST